MAPKAKNSNAALIELFLDMVAAERGGAKNTLAAYARDLADFSAALATPDLIRGSEDPRPRAARRSQRLRILRFAILALGLDPLAQERSLHSPGTRNHCSSACSAFN